MTLEKPKVLELFAGGGGMATGLREAGFRHLALFESDTDAVATLQANAKSGVGAKPDIPIYPVDVRQICYNGFQSDISLLAAGAPCQPFSLAGNHLGLKDDRNLFPEVFRAQRELSPRAVLLENVWGLGRPSFRPYLEYILLQLALPHRKARHRESWLEHKLRLESAVKRTKLFSEPTYDVRIAVLECADFGVPQRRNRIFMVALRTDLNAAWTWPAPNHSKLALLCAKHLSGTYWREHNLRGKCCEDADFQLSLIPLNGQERWRTVRDVLRDLPAPASAKTGDLYHPNHYRIDGCRPYRGHTGSLMDEPAKTLKAGVHGVPGGENMVHISERVLRYFSLHESALLQTFPSSYVFCGTRSAVIKQIGNAAPTLIVKILAKRIRRLVGGPTLPISCQYTPPQVDLLDGSVLR